jgi:hypothetical protein
MPTAIIRVVLLRVEVEGRTFNIVHGEPQGKPTKIVEYIAPGNLYIIPFDDEIHIQFAKCLLEQKCLPNMCLPQRKKHVLTNRINPGYGRVWEPSS